jgi:hypothetical protein
MALVSVVIVLAALAAVAGDPAPKAPAETAPAQELPPLKTVAVPESAWTPLFNGRDLEGWKATGNASFKVEDGCLVGTPVEAKGGDLFTEKEFDNFEVRFTYKALWPANSGVWFRTKYQFDILDWKKPEALSGTLYCPGKMFIFANLDKSIEDRAGWNEGQIYANGDRIILWLNGRKTGECGDKTADKGKIGIQVHGGAEFKDMKVFYKRIEIRPLKPGDPPGEPAAPKKDPPKAGTK